MKVNEKEWQRNKDRQEEWDDASYSESVRAKLFGCAFKLGIF